MCIMHCRKYHLHNCNRTYLHNCNRNYNKNYQPHLCCRNCHVICICAPETSNCIIATETVTCLIATERSTNIPVTKVPPQNLHKCNVFTCIIPIESVSCIVPTETSTCRIDYRNFNLQKWCQSEIRLVTIKKLSK